MIFADYRDRYAGKEGWIIGRGPTDFKKEELAQADGPVWFINEAVAWEDAVQHDDTFFIALEWKKFAAIAWGIKSISMAGFMEPKDLSGLTRLVEFQHSRGGTADPWAVRGALWFLLGQSADTLAYTRKLYLHGSTMLPAIHFAWFCGVRHLNLVGCDCIPTKRVEGRPATSKVPAECYNPDLPVIADDHGNISGGKHPTLRLRHDAVMDELKIFYKYCKTPLAMPGTAR